VRAQDRDEKDKDDLSKDRWSAPPDRSPRAKTISTVNPASLVPLPKQKNPSRPPVSVGFEGRRGRQQKFDATIGVHVGMDPPGKLARPDAQLLPPKTLDGIYMPHPPTDPAMPVESVASPTVRPQSTPPPLSNGEVPGQDPSVALQVESFSVERPRFSQMPRTVRQESPNKQAQAAGAVRMFAAAPMFSLTASFYASSLLLLLNWFVPDLLQPPFTLPLQLVASARGIKLVGLLAAPLVGSLFLSLAIAPLSDTLRSLFGLVLGLSGLVLTLLYVPLALPLAGWIVLLLALPMIPGAALAHKVSDTPLIGHIAAAALPFSFFLVAVMGFALGFFPLSYAAALKPPFLLWAFIQASSVCLATLVWQKAGGSRS
jgi:hypothetical protein